MSLPRLTLIAVLALGGLGATSALAGSDRGLAGGPPVVSRGGLPLDPELLPPNSGPGDCVVRRVTGPGGAYRWDRVECDREGGWTHFDQWGYGRGRLDVETAPPPPPQVHASADARHDYSVALIDRDDRRGPVRFEGQAYATGGGYVAGQAPPPRGDRYGDDRRYGHGYERREESYEHSRERYEDERSYVGGQAYYTPGLTPVGADVGDRYGPIAPPNRQGYRYAGRDAGGYLVWPDKTP